MARAFLTRTQDDEDEQVAANIIGREAEIADYDRNIASFTHQLESLDPADTAGAQALEARIASEQSQLAISERAYQSMLAALPAGTRRDNAITRAQAKLAPKE